MANIKAYDPFFYANEAINELRKSLGMAGRVYRGYDRTPQEKGSTILIRKPSTFVAKDAPSTAQDLETDQLSVVLDQWKEVKFKVSDKDLSLSDERLISDHINPAAYALADDIDQKLCGLYKFIPTYTGAAGTALGSDGKIETITKTRAQMRKQKVPLNDVSKLHFMVDPDSEGALLALEAFSQYQGAGDVGVATQMNGTLGRKYGYEFFANQNVLTHTKGTASTATLAVNGAVAKGNTAVALDAAAVTGTVVAGDLISFAGHDHVYCIAATATAAANAFAVVTLTEKLRADVADDEVATLVLQNGVRNMAFHENFACLAMAPLSDMAAELGAKVAIAHDPVTNIALRSRIFYDGNASDVYVALDCLYGYKMLRSELAVNVLG